MSMKRIFTFDPDADDYIWAACCLILLLAVVFGWVW